MPSFSLSKTQEVVLFSSTAIALYGYDQGMMSLINTNDDYLRTMGIGAEDPMVGILVAVYYLGCSLGAVLFSWLSDNHGRKKAIFACLATASLGNLIMFITGLGGWTQNAIHMFCQYKFSHATVPRPLCFVVSHNVSLQTQSR